MSRYFIGRKTSKLWSQEMPETYAPTPKDAVTVFDIEAVNTGLVSEDGQPIMKSMDKVGFIK